MFECVQCLLLAVEVRDLWFANMQGWKYIQQKRKVAPFGCLWRWVAFDSA